jgi:uncharacterized membrane protein (UPF0127 family)
MAHCGYSGSMQLPDGSNLKLRLALNNVQKEKGLSGIAADDFADDEALLMVFFNYGPRSVLMGDTNFNLDVFFLDHTLTVDGLQRNLTAHPGTTEPPLIEESREIKARHILEMRSVTSQASQIEQGARLKWASSPTIHQIERCMAAIWYRNKGQ